MKKWMIAAAIGCICIGVVSGCSDKAANKLDNFSSTETTEETTELTEHRLTLQYACENCNVTESDFDGIDFDALVDYYGLTEENVNEGPLMFLIDDYKGLEYKIKLPDYMVGDIDKDTVSVDDLREIDFILIEDVHEETADETVIDFKNRIVLVGSRPGTYLLTEDNIVAEVDDAMEQRVVDILTSSNIMNWKIKEKERTSTEVHPPYCTFTISFTDGSKYGISDITAEFESDEDEQAFYDLVKDLERLTKGIQL